MVRMPLARPLHPRARAVTERAGRALGGLALMATLVAVLAGCGVQSDHTAGASEGDDQATLPTLPPVEERLPGAYDEDGCLILSEGRDCAASADQLDEALAGDESARTLSGFEGPLFVTDLSAGVVAVLTDTVRTATSGPWQAEGLLRNETTSPVIAPMVTAVLRGADGAELDRVTAAALVAPVRPGEPAPFTLVSDVEAAAVADVDWSVTDDGGEPPAGTRDLELTTYFAEPAGTREALDLYLYQETGRGPFPFVLYGSITDGADVDAVQPTVVAAWLDDDGRVRAVAESAAVDPDGRPSQTLAPGELSDFLLTVSGDADGLDSAPLLLWATSR